MEIQRQFYLDELIRKQGNGFVKIITGLRRCGKSYLLRTIFKNHLLANGIAPEEIVEMAFDELVQSGIVTEAEVANYRSIQ